MTELTDDQLAKIAENIDNYSDKTVERILKKCLKKYQNDKKTGSKDKLLCVRESAIISNLTVARVTRLVRQTSKMEWITQTGEYSEDAMHFLLVFHDLPEKLESVSVEYDYLLETKTCLAKMALDSNVVENICELIIDIYQRRMIKYWTSPYLWVPLRHAMGIIWNYTDTSEEWAERIAHSPDFLYIIRKVLLDVSDKTSTSTFSDEERWVLLAALEITFNVSMVDTSITILRKKKFTKALQPHLDSSNEAEQLITLSSLAGIVNEEESEIITSNKAVVKHLMNVFRKGLATEQRRYEGHYDSWKCKECAITIKRLARNDANKRMLVQLGALELLVQLAKGSTEEQIEALNAMWTLSFDEENRKEMTSGKDSEVISTLSTFLDSSTDSLKSAAHGTLWNLRQDLLTSENKTYQEIGNKLISEDKPQGATDRDFTENMTTPEEKGSLIMISYHHSDQTAVIEIRNELQKHGFKVWLDTSGSTLEAMAEAVKTAHIVLICFSQKYKISPVCRSEAEYAFIQQKDLIHIKMEKDYIPDGWLGVLVGTSLWHDFTEKSNFKESFQTLLSEVQRVYESK